MEHIKSFSHKTTHKTEGIVLTHSNSQFKSTTNVFFKVTESCMIKVKSCLAILLKIGNGHFIL